MQYTEFDRLSIGDTIYFSEQLTGFITKGTISDKIIDDKSQMPYCICNCHLGTLKCRYDKIFTSKEECSNALAAQFSKQVNAYKKEITDISSLLKFAITYVIADAETYSNYEARKAFIEKAKEICNVDLS